MLAPGRRPMREPETAPRLRGMTHRGRVIALTVAMLLIAVAAILVVIVLNGVTDLLNGQDRIQEAFGD